MTTAQCHHPAGHHAKDDPEPHKTMYIPSPRLEVRNVPTLAPVPPG